ncbi:MAG: hypothetical protein WC506_00545 [Candidatus Micrarchaeia archaeon]
MSKLKISRYLFFLLVFAVLPSLVSAAALSGTGCTAGGNCVVSSSQTIDNGGTYYFNSLVINSGVTVTLASSTNSAGGTVTFYVANDANISGAIAANAGSSNSNPAGSNPNGGGYGGARCTTCCCDNPGAGGGVISIYARNLNLPGSLSVNGGTASGCNGGGSAGTIKMYANKITFTGSLSGVGGNGANNGCGNGGGGGGAGGSLIFMSSTTSSLASGSMNFNGGTGYNGGVNGGGSGRAGGGSTGGGGAGGSGGVASGASGGSANANRNIKIYNAYVTSGSSFSISSSGSSAGLASLFLVNSSTKFSALSTSYRPEKILACAFSNLSAPVASANFTLLGNSQQALFSIMTASDGLGLSNSTLDPSINYSISVNSVPANAATGFAYSNSTGFPAGSNSSIAGTSGAAMYIDWLAGGQIAIKQGTRPTVPNTTAFGGTSTNFSAVSDLTNVANLTLDKPGTGTIMFPPTHNVNAAGQDYDANVKIGTGFVSVNSSALDSSFNSTATLSMNLSGLYSGNLTPDIYYYSGFANNSSAIVQNGALCISPRCTGMSWNSTTRMLAFNVSGFSGYSVNTSAFGGSGTAPFNNTATLGINITSTNQIAVYTASSMNNSAFSFVPVVPPAAGSIVLTSNESSNVTGGDTGFLVENQGNVNVSISVTSDKSAASFIGGSSPLFQMFGGVNETSACPSLNASAQDLSASAITVCPSLAFSDSQDTIWAYVLVKIDSDSPPQTSTATLTFTSTQA